MTIVRLYQLLFFVLLLWGCDKDSDNITKGGDKNVDLGADPLLNKHVLANKGGELLKLDPATGAQTAFFTFHDVNVSSLDYADGVIYAGAMDNSINAISMQNGELLWDVPIIEYENTVLATPDVVVEDGIAYAIGTTGVMLAIDVTNKQLKWAIALHPDGETDQRYHLTTTPTVIGDKVAVGTYFSDKTNYVHLLEKTTGKSIWSKELNEGDYAFGRIIASGSSLLITSSVLQAWDINTGDLQWEFKPSEDHYNVGVPVVKDGKIFLNVADGISSGKLVCLNASDGRKLWEQRAGITSVVGFEPTVVGNYVFAVEQHGAAYGDGYDLLGKAFLADAGTGSIFWKNEEVFVQSSPVYANGRLYFYGYHTKGSGTTDDRSGLICLDASNGKFLWLNSYFSYSDHISPMIIAENGIFKAHR